ncbi:MAG: 50S ribosomal protein L18 [bacterium]|nr:50S ribosomal protein L18 [bacterium]
MRARRKDLRPRERRARVIRKRIRGTSERPRLCVFCSLRYIYAQVIDDSTGRTLASASSMRRGGPARCNIAAAREVGAALAVAAKAAGVTKVVFDRSGYKYHGRVKALAEAAREGGLEF